MEKFNEIDVVVGIAEVLLQEVVDAGFKQESVVDSNHTNTILAEPAWLTTTSDGGIHNIIRDQKEGLQLQSIKLALASILLIQREILYKFDKPAEYRSLENIVFRHRFTLQDTDSVNN